MAEEADVDLTDDEDDIADESVFDDDDEPIIGDLEIASLADGID